MNRTFLAPSQKRNFINLCIFVAAFGVVDFLLQILRCNAIGWGKLPECTLPVNYPPLRLAANLAGIVFVLMLLIAFFVWVGSLFKVPLFSEAHYGLTGALRWALLGAGSAVIEQASRLLPLGVGIRTTSFTIGAFLLYWVIFHLLSKAKPVENP